MDTLPYWLASLYLPNTSIRSFLASLQQYKDIKSLFDEQKPQVNWSQVESDLAWAESHPDNHIIAFSDPEYPALLKEIADPPLVLFLRGNKALLGKRQISIVGARNATPTGLKNAEYFAQTLSASGFVITSGLALGIDGASHKGALSASGKTIGVCGTGLNHLYPRSHTLLANSMIQKGGAIISEFPLNIKALAQNFPRRNRIIAGLSLGVLVIEAAIKSGSLITARHAIEQGREVFAIPGSIHNPLSRGCHHLIRQGAKLVESSQDILEEFGANQGKLWPEQKKQMDLSPREQHLLEQIGYEITSMDVIHLRSGLTTGEVSSILLILEIKGYIQTVPGGYIRSS